MVFFSKLFQAILGVFMTKVHLPPWLGPSLEVLPWLITWLMYAVCAISALDLYMKKSGLWYGFKSILWVIFKSGNLVLFFYFDNVKGFDMVDNLVDVTHVHKCTRSLHELKQAYGVGSNLFLGSFLDPKNVSIFFSFIKGPMKVICIIKANSKAP